jgi:colanic acid/amylovoran biosynthesis glycosyltransferase
VSRGSVVGEPVVAHVTRAYLKPTEAFIYNQLTHLRRYRPIVVCHHRHGGFPLDQGMVALESLSRPVQLVDTVADRLVRTPLPTTMGAMARFVEEGGAKVLHFHFLVNARSYLALKERTDLPAVVSAYGYDVSSFPHRGAGMGRRYLAPIFSRIDSFLAMSDEMRRDLIDLGCPEERIRVHYHGIDVRRFAVPDRRYEDRRPVAILSCGRLVPTKGQLRLVEALSVVRRRCSVPFRLVIVGDGPLRHALEQAVHRLGMSAVVELVGHVPYAGSELAACYREADVFALPCINDGQQREGLPGAIVEAMAAGLPIVSTRHGGIPAAVTDGRDGLLVPEGDIDRLADALEAVLVDDGLRRRLGTEAARRAARDLDVGPATARLEQIYDDLRR